MTSWLSFLADVISKSFWLAPILAFSAGALTSFTPCGLSSIPLVIGYVEGTANNDTTYALKLSGVFCLGMAITFTTLGVVASLMGKLIQQGGSWWYIALGILMILMALQTWGVFTFIPSWTLVSKSKNRGYVGAAIAGALSGLFSSPCATPVIIVLLALVADQGSILWGGFLLLMYAAGHSVLPIVAGTSIGFAQKLSRSTKYANLSKGLNVLLGLAILGLAFYMLYLGF